MRIALRLLAVLLMLLLSACCKSGKAHPPATQISAQRLDQVLNPLAEEGDLSIGWLLPTDLMSQSVHFSASEALSTQAILNAVAADPRFSIQNIGNSRVILPRDLQSRLPKNLTMAGSYDDLKKKFDFCVTPREMKLDALEEIILMAGLNAEGVTFPGQKETRIWSARLPDVTLEQLLVLLAAAQNKQVHGGDGRLVYQYPHDPS